MISVIIPAYNEEKYLPRCLESLKKQQTKHTFEILVVNNNSKDSTKKIAQQFEVRVIDEPRQGLAIAKNAGVAATSGEIICFIDADCIVPVSHLDTVAQLFETTPKLDALSGPVEFYDAGPLVNLFVNRFKYYYWYHRLLSKIGSFVSITGGNFCILRKSFEKIDGFSENLRDINLPEDLELAIRAAQKNLKVVFAKDLVVYTSNRRYAGKFTLDGIKRSANTLKTLRKQ